MSEQQRAIETINIAAHLKKWRKDRSLTRYDIEQKAQISSSFYSQLETGARSARREVLRRVTEALDMPINVLDIDVYGPALRAILDFQDPKTAIKEGIELQDKAPHLVEDIPKILANLARVYDKGDWKEIVYPILLRAEQEREKNQYIDIENAAKEFIEEHYQDGATELTLAELVPVLMYKYNYKIYRDFDFEEKEYEHLPIIRSMWVRENKKNYLLLNRNLLESQKAFEVAKEIAYNRPFMNGKETFNNRVDISPRIEVQSYTQIRNEFKSAFFAGAVLMPREKLEIDLLEFFGQEKYKEEILYNMLKKYNVTPEMLLHRMTEILPGERFGIEKLHFLRFHHNRREDKLIRVFSLTKFLNINSLNFPYVESSAEKYCRRYNAIRTLRELRNSLDKNEITESQLYDRPIIRTQRSQFVHGDNRDLTYLCITIARPLKLQPNILSSASIGFVVDDHFKKVVHFWNDIENIDPKGEEVEWVGHTCQRCPMTKQQCLDRAAEPVIFQQMKRNDEAMELRAKARHAILS